MLPWHHGEEADGCHSTSQPLSLWTWDREDRAQVLGVDTSHPTMVSETELKLGVLGIPQKIPLIFMQGPPKKDTT